MFAKVNSVLAVGAVIFTTFLLPNFGEARIGSPASSPIGSVVFVRHGESEWNSAKRFTGWYDVMLTELGELVTFWVFL